MGEKAKSDYRFTMSIAVVKTKVIACPRLAGTLMTLEEFDAMKTWKPGWRYELIHGVLIVTPLPLEGEVDPNEELGHWLRNYQESDPEGKYLDCTLFERTVKTRRSRRRADRVLWTGLGRLPDPQVDVPSVVAEFVSKKKRDRQRDYQEKRDEYMEIGVSEYWIIDRFRRIMTVIRNQPGGPVEIVVREHETYRTPLLPGFELPVGKLLAVANRWERRK